MLFRCLQGMKHYQKSCNIYKISYVQKYFLKLTGAHNPDGLYQGG